MAYSEQTFTNLGTVQQPDASQSTAFAGSNPFAFSESTNQLLNQVSQLAVKKREDEVKMYNENLQTALTKAGNIPDDLSPQDYEVVSKKVKEYYKKLYENPETLLGQNPEKSRELNGMLVDLASYTKLSKATKKIEDNYSELIKKDSDWNNEVNNYYLEQYKSTADPNERAKKSFTPIKNPINDFQTLVVPKLQSKPESTRVEITEDPIDKGSKIYSEISVFNKDVYKEAFKNYNGMYLTEEWNVKPELQQQYPNGAQEYIDAKAEETFQPTATKSSKMSKNVQYTEEQKNARNEATIDSREAEGQKNRVSAERRVQMREQAKIDNASTYPDLQQPIYEVDKLLGEGTEYKIPSLVSKSLSIPNTTKIEKLNSGNAPTELNRKIYTGENASPSFGTYFKITEKGKEPYVVKGKVVYSDKMGKVISEESAKTADGKAEIDESRTVIVPDLSAKYTRENLIEENVSNSLKANQQLSEWRKNKKAYEEESSSKGTYKGVNEMFYTPIGITVDRGVERKGTLSNPKEAQQHNDHVHLAFDDSDVAVEIMDEAKRRGLSVKGNEYAGKNTHSKNTSLGRASAHGLSFGNGVGKGADIGHENTDKERREFFIWVQENYGNGAPTTTASTKKGTFTSKSGIKFTVE